MNNSLNVVNRSGFSTGFVGLLFTGGLLLSVAAYGETMEEKLKVQAEQEKKELAAAEEKRQAEKDAKAAAAKKEKDRKAAAAEKKAQEEADRKAAARAKAKREAAAEKDEEAKRLAEEQAKPEPPPVAIAEPSAAHPVASGGYTVNGDGTVTDPKTNLMWKQCSEGQSGSGCSGAAASYKWDDAMSKFGKNVSFAGYSDWRMPTKDELRTLVYCSNGTSQAMAWDQGCGDNYQRPTIDLKAFPNTLEHWYWSSTEDIGAWRVDFRYGYDGWVSRSYNPAVRLVRSGQ